MPEATRVLVVEDDPAVRRLLVCALTDDGHAVTAAANGSEALAAVRGGCRPDVVLLDVQMPVMDGPAFAAAYRLLPAPYAPIVLVSAALGLAEVAERVHAYDFLAKPLDLDRLAASVTAAAEGAPPPVRGA